VQYWPLREVLISYIAYAREVTAEGFRHIQLLWQIGTVFGGADRKNAPAIPPLLRGEPRE
jgi:hypothetical protein